MKKTHGFTLVECIIVMVIMALAMITMSKFLVPQVTRSSNPHYQTRAAALGQSVMATILARGFDHNSDFKGGEVRCGEVALGGADCSLVLGSEEAEVSLYNDVDDYIGCWIPDGALATNGCKDLNALVGDSDTTYHNFRLDIEVTQPRINQVKHIVLTISAPNQTPIVLHADKGNY